MASIFSHNKPLYKPALFLLLFPSLCSWTTASVNLPIQPQTARLSTEHAAPLSLNLWHQGMFNQLQIVLDYAVKESNPRLAHETLMHEVAQLLMSYPEEYHYWEIVNLAITQNLLNAYPQLEQITLQLAISPNEYIHHQRISTVTRWSHGDVSESWRVEDAKVAFQGRMLNANINYHYRDSAVYPDYVDICAQLEAYLETLAAGDMPLEQLERDLARHLSEHYVDAISDILVQLEMGG